MEFDGVYLMTELCCESWVFWMMVSCDEDNGALNSCVCVSVFGEKDTFYIAAWEER